MKKNHIKILVGLISVGALVFFVQTFVKASVYVADSGSISGILSEFNVSDSTSSNSSGSVKALKSPPSRLIISSLNINANIQEVGLKANGDMGTPNNFTDVGWYYHGTIPGNIGSAVIDGHVDNGLGLSGVFKRLNELNNGDIIQVVWRDGTIVKFKVTNSDWYNYESVPINSIFNQKDSKYLRLITCGGSWVSTDKTYNKRLVVTAIMIKN